LLLLLLLLLCSGSGAGVIKGGPKSREVVTPEPVDPPLPEAWDCSIGGLRGLLDRLNAGGA